MKNKLSNNTIAVILILLAMCAQLWFALRYSVNVAYWEHFDYIPLLQKFSLRECFLQYLDHRQVIPKLLYVLLARLTKWNVRVEVFFNWLFLQGIVFSLFSILKRNVTSKNLWVIVAAIYFFLTPQYYINLLHGFHLCIQLVLFFVMGALFAFSVLKNSWGRVIVAALWCMGASFSFANGLITWIVFFPLVFMRGENTPGVSMKIIFWRERWKILYWALFGVMVTKVYFYNYQDHLQVVGYPLAYPWKYPQNFFSYFFVLIGTGFLGVGRGFFDRFTHVHLIAGMLLSLIFIFGCFFNLFSLKKNALKLCLLFFVFLAAGCIALGRANSNWGLGSALAHRFREFTVFVPIVMLSMLIEGPAMKRGIVKAISVFLFLGLLWGTFFGWRTAILEGRAWYAKQQENRKILLSFETASDEQLARIYPRPNALREFAVILKNMKYNVFD